MILRRRAYIRTLQLKTNQFSEKKITHHGFPRKINAEALKKAGDEGWSKKRDNPERGRKPLIQFLYRKYLYCKKRDNPERGRKRNYYYIRSSGSVKKEITPRGDGNHSLNLYNFFSFVKKEITPRGDGNK